MMPKRSSKKKRPRDANQLAKAIVDEATSEDQPETSEEETQESTDGKNPAAVALGRLGGLKGGPARAKKLTPKKRIEIAKRAAKARWHKSEE